MKKEVFKKIEKKIRFFDLCSLIKLLNNLGFHQDDIYFESHLSHHSPISLCEKIVFSKESPRVRVVLNMGLLSNNSPLPSFFTKYIENDEIDGEKFLRFLSFFNHHLIKDYLRLSLPEKNSLFFQNWRDTHYYYLSLLGFESISTLWTIFKDCFPELNIKVTKNTRMMRLNASTLILGKDGLGGKSTVGEKLQETLSSFRIVLNTEEEISETLVPWPVEINRRLMAWIFPILKKTDIHLSIILKIKNKWSSLHLKKNHYLGFDRIGKRSYPFQLLLFHGFIKDLQINTYLAKEMHC